MLNTLHTTAQALGLHHHPVDADGHLRARALALHVVLAPDGHVTLSVQRTQAPVLYAHVHAAPDRRHLRAAHQLQPATLAEVEVLRDALLALVPPAAANLALDRLAIAPHLGSATPWGEALTCTEVEPGVYRVTTSRHGGYWADAEVLAALPASAQLQGGWYEQDLQAAVLAAALGWYRDDPERQRDLRAVLQRHFPELLPLIGDSA